MLAKATELKKLVWFTLGSLIVYHFATHLPVASVDAAVMSEILAQHGGGIPPSPVASCARARPSR